MIRICTYNVFGWKTHQWENNVVQLTELFQRLDCDVYSMNEVFEPDVNWNDFVIGLNKKLIDLDDGFVPPKQTKVDFEDVKKPIIEEITGHLRDPTAFEPTSFDHLESKNNDSIASSSLDPPQAPPLQNKQKVGKYQRKIHYSENDLKSVSKLKYFSGKACHSAYNERCLGNALFVNQRRNKVFQNRLCQFSNQLLTVSGVETRGACRVLLDHPFIGPISVYSLHLDHQNENWRFEQLEQLLSKIDQNLPHIIMGDFNSLTKTDYTDSYLEEVAEVRREGQWELPQFKVTERIAEMGYVDLWRMTNPDIQDLDVSTCQYYTRIDYIYVSKLLAGRIDWKSPETYCHILNGVFHSDHFPVMANIKFKS